jgi:hypothetical protein
VSQKPAEMEMSMIMDITDDKEAIYTTQKCGKGITQSIITFKLFMIHTNIHPTVGSKILTWEFFK